MSTPTVPASALGTSPPSRLLSEFSELLSTLVGLPVLEAGQQILGAHLVFGAEHLRVLSAEAAERVSAALSALGISAVAGEGDLGLQGSLTFSSEDGLWALSGPSGTLTCAEYECTLTGEGEDREAAARSEAFFSELVGERLLGVSLEVDGTLVLSFPRHTFRVWPPALSGDAGISGEGLACLHSWSLMTLDDVWFHMGGSLAVTSPDAPWGAVERSEALEAGVSAGSLPLDL